MARVADTLAIDSGLSCWILSLLNRPPSGGRMCFIFVIASTCLKATEMQADGHSIASGYCRPFSHSAQFSRSSERRMHNLRLQSIAINTKTIAGGIR